MVSRQLSARGRRNVLVLVWCMVYHMIRAVVVWLLPSRWRRKSVHGQTVLITGAGSGIGAQLALRFAKLGCRLVLWDRDESGLRETAAALRVRKIDPRKVHIMTVDLTDRVAIYEAAKRVRLSAGAVDILVNNAGVVTGKYLLDTPDDRIETTFAVNVLAHFYTVKCFLPDMIRQRRGHIVTVASASAHYAVPKVIDYCASKYANVGFDLALRMELAQTQLDQCIMTTIVKPHLTSTGMFHGVAEGIFAYLDPTYVADCVVDGVLTNAREIVLPHYLVLFFWLVQLLPHQSMVALMEMLGGMDAMNGFAGRTPNSPTEPNNAFTQHVTSQENSPRQMATSSNHNNYNGSDNGSTTSNISVQSSKSH